MVQTRSKNRSRKRKRYELNTPTISSNKKTCIKKCSCNSNSNGWINFENKTELKNKYNIVKSSNSHSIINFTGYEENNYIMVKKTQLFKYMEIDKNSMDTSAGCVEPDECYINESKKYMFIIEKKYQQVNGTACEKIQTPDYKKWKYSRMFPSYRIVYIYCLSNWFKTNCKSEMLYLYEKSIPIFWGDNRDYKDKLITFINEFSISGYHRWRYQFSTSFVSKLLENKNE